MCPDDHMHMIGHNAVTMNNKPFVFLIEFNIVRNHLFETFLFQYFYPAYGSECNKIGLVTFVDFLFI